MDCDICFLYIKAKKNKLNGKLIPQNRKNKWVTDIHKLKVNNTISKFMQNNFIKFVQNNLFNHRIQTFQVLTKISKKCKQEWGNKRFMKIKQPVSQKHDYFFSANQKRFLATRIYTKNQIPRGIFLSYKKLTEKTLKY